MRRCGIAGSAGTDESGFGEPARRVIQERFTDGVDAFQLAGGIAGEGDAATSRVADDVDLACGVVADIDVPTGVLKCGQHPAAAIRVRDALAIAVEVREQKSRQGKLQLFTRAVIRQCESVRILDQGRVEPERCDIRAAIFCERRQEFRGARERGRGAAVEETDVIGQKR